MRRKLQRGDYVLATKYADGCSGDHFVVGFFDRQDGDRYMVLDSNGQQFRANGFRRCERIGRRVGDAIVRNIPIIESCRDKGLWYWRWHPGQLV